MVLRVLEYVHTYMRQPYLEFALCIARRYGSYDQRLFHTLSIVRTIEESLVIAAVMPCNTQYTAQIPDTVEHVRT